MAEQTIIEGIKPDPLQVLASDKHITEIITLDATKNPFLNPDYAPGMEQLEAATLTIHERRALDFTRRFLGTMHTFIDDFTDHDSEREVWRKKLDPEVAEFYYRNNKLRPNITTSMLGNIDAVQGQKIEPLLADRKEERSQLKDRFKGYENLPLKEKLQLIAECEKWGRDFIDALFEKYKIPHPPPAVTPT